MHLIKRSLKVLPLALVAASLMAPSAMAATPATAKCAFTGLAGNLTPPVPAAPTLGGSGTFTFGGSATCALSHGGGPAVPVNATINASGRYDNTVCGTGTATGTASITFQANSTGTTSANATFSINFASGVGALHISSFVDNQGHKGQGGGEVTIVPAQGSCTSGGVSAFTVAGGFAVAGQH